MHVTVSRKGWTRRRTCPARSTIELGPLVIGEDKQPALGSVTETREWTVGAGKERTFAIPTPKPPFRVEVTVDPTFVPAAARSVERRDAAPRRGRRLPVRAPEGRDEVGEAQPQREPRERRCARRRRPAGAAGAAASGAAGTGTAAARSRPSPRARSSRAHGLERELARVEVEDELRRREPGHAAEERLAVVGVVDRAEDRRRGDRPGRLVRVEVAGARPGRRAGAAPPRPSARSRRRPGSRRRAPAGARRGRRRRTRGRGRRRPAASRGPSETTSSARWAR